jgi:adenosylcobinamide-phosphate synthase
MAEMLLYPAALLLATLSVGLLLPLPLSYHPMSFVGIFCRLLARKVHPDPQRPAGQQTLSGVLALLLLLVLPLTCWYGLNLMSAWPLLLDAIVILCCFSWPGYRSLARKISNNLQKQQLSLARSQAQALLLRECKGLSEMGLAKALLEALSLHFQQQVTALIFWYLLAGAPGVLLCRLSQIASQQWSVKNPPNQNFGLAAARLAAIFNSPAYLLGALLFRLQGQRKATAAAIRNDGIAYHRTKLILFMQLSRALRVSLGGPARYGHTTQRRHRLQQQYEPGSADVRRLLTLLDYQLCTLFVVLALFCVIVTFS